MNKKKSEKNKETLTDEQLINISANTMRQVFQPFAEQLNKATSDIEKLFAIYKEQESMRVNQREDSNNSPKVCNTVEARPEIKRVRRTLFETEPEFVVRELFRYHKPEEWQIENYNELRVAARSFAKTVIENVPNTQLRRQIIILIWQANMLANGSIATSGIL